MALIRQIIQLQKERYAAHPEAECSFSVFDIKGVTFFQLDTYGRPGRKRPGQISQSIQLNEEMAVELIEILLDAFPGLGKNFAFIKRDSHTA